MQQTNICNDLSRRTPTPLVPVGVVSVRNAPYQMQLVAFCDWSAAP